MKQIIFILRYNISAILINLGLTLMPQSAYKRELLRRMYELKMEVISAIENFKKENTDGNQ